MLRTKSIAVFLLIVFAISWLIELGMWLAGGMANTAVFGLGAVAVMLVPAVGAALVRLIFKEGFADASLRLGRLRFYPLTYLLVLSWALVTYALTWALGLGKLDLAMPEVSKQLPPGSPAIPYWLILVAYLTINPLASSIFTFGEEFGWRGYLLVRLLPLGKAKAMLVVGLVWGVWHAPLILMGYNYPGYPLPGAGMMIPVCIALSFIFGALFLDSGSILVPTLAHSCVNNFASAFAVVTTGCNPLLGGATGVVGLGVWLLVIGWLYLRDTFER